LEFLLESGATSKQLTEREVIHDDDAFSFPCLADNAVIT
jgi:hypothetical protein